MIVKNVAGLGLVATNSFQPQQIFDEMIRCETKFDNNNNNNGRKDGEKNQFEIEITM